jgi:hypothetical protein
MKYQWLICSFIFAVAFPAWPKMGHLVEVGKNKVLFKDDMGKVIQSVPYIPYNEADWAKSPMSRIEQSYLYDKVEVLFGDHVVILHSYRGYENTQVLSMTFYDPTGKKIEEDGGGSNVFISPDRKYLISYGWIEGSGDDHLFVCSYKGKNLKTVRFEKGKPTAWVDFKFTGENTVIFKVTYQSEGQEKERKKSYKVVLPRL